ncbi:hypothetical protein [Pseudomonas sp. H1h]|uniref:hypothetical protein n=1 Tax=Pseudomonas sp. H1h TaxID=1397280 RepID=UPI00046AB365|nr:hypothetical protein [Pseudomonas sp. H1h]
MDNIAPALIAFTSAVLVGFFGHFTVEDYRRFRDSKAIAAALAGELGSIISSLLILRSGLNGMKASLDEGQPMQLAEMPDQSSPIFEANAEKIGLLGVALAGDVAFIYDRIRAFRTSFQMLSKHHTTRPLLWSSLLVGSCTQLIVDNESKAENLVKDLKIHADVSYATSNPLRVMMLSGTTLLSLISVAAAAFYLLNGTASVRPTPVQFTQFCIQHIYTDTSWNH